jgi:hypothetical protein
MNCPKCGTQNPDDVQVCTSCGSELTLPPTTSESIKVKTSIFAITAFVFAILTLFLLPFALPLRGNPIVGIWLIAAILAIFLGIVGLIEIGLSAGKVAGKAFAAMAVAIPVVFYFVMCFLAVLARPRSIAFRMVCGSNLSGIGRAMLIYANDYDNEFPRAGFVDTKWGSQVFNWAAPDRSAAFGLERGHTGGSATISSSLYLLVKYAEVTPKSFVCDKDTRSTEFKPAKYGVRDIELEDLWDFGPNPAKHCSYSYHMPYGSYFLSTASSEPGQAVAADRNPWLDPYTDTTGFKWDDQTKTGPPENIKRYNKGNSGPHQREGQNVLFMDNHVYFEKQSFCGVNEDNIYTYWDDSDIRQGAPPILISQPADRLDSLLVNEQPASTIRKTP